MTEAIERDRTSFIGASEIGAMLGHSSFSTPWEVWARKTGRIKEKAPTGDMLRGIHLEPVVKDVVIPGLTRAFEWDTREMTFIHPEHPFIQAHPDGRIALDDQLLMGSLEIKCPSSNYFRTIKEDGLPRDNVFQLNTSIGMARLAGSKQTHGTYVIHCADSWETLLFPLAFEEDLFEWSLRQTVAFWNDYVLADKVPPDFAPTAGMPEIPEITGDLQKRHDDVWLGLMEEAHSYREIKAQMETIWNGTEDDEGNVDPATGLKERILTAMGPWKSVEGGDMRATRVVSKRRNFSKKLVIEASLIDPKALAESGTLQKGADVRDCRADLDDDRFYTTSTSTFPKLTEKPEV